MKANAPLLFVSLAIVATAASACGNRLLVGQDPDGGAPSGAAGQGLPTSGAAGESPPTTGAAGASGAPNVIEQPTGAPSCGPSGDRYRPTSIAALKVALRGTWELCSSVGLFSRTQDGVFIGNDDKYVLLTRVNGALVARTGFENKGHLEYLDTSNFDNPNSYQVNFVGDHGATIISHPVLSDGPRKVIINNNGVEEYTYGRVGPAGTPSTTKVVTPLRISGEEAIRRLAKFVWLESPSADLLSQAQLGRFKNTDDLYGAIRQLLADPRARRGLGTFYRWWLELDKVKDATKDALLFPEYTPLLAADMAAETETFGVEVTLGGGSFTTLMTAPYSYINERLAGIYGVAGITGEALQKAILEPKQRAGLVTQPALQALNSYEKRNSPSRRGGYMLRQFQCLEVPAPPPNVLPLPDTLPTNVTVREALAMNVSNQANCQACHVMLDPPGLAFETFDAIGRWRTTDNGFPIDMSNISIMNLTDDANPTTVDGPVAFASALAGSDRVQECMARQWLSYFTGVRLSELDETVVKSVTATFRASGLDLKELISAVLTSDAFLAP